MNFVRYSSRYLSRNVLQFKHVPPVNRCKLRKFCTTDVKGPISNFEVKSEEDAHGLLEKCSAHLSMQSQEKRTAYLNKVWGQLRQNEAVLTVQVWNGYLRTCLENGIAVDHARFLDGMSCTPDRETYYLLLEATCSRGDVRSANDVMVLIKKNGVALNERVFNALIYGHIFSSGLESAKPVFEMMRTAKIDESSTTKWTIINALANRGDETEFVEILRTLPKLPADESQFLKVVRSLGLNGNHLWLDKLLDFTGSEVVAKAEMDNVYACLVHNNKLEAAVHFYQRLCKIFPHDYGVILDEMVAARIPNGEAIKVAKQIATINSRAVFDLTELLLKNRLADEALEAFEHLDYLRPHFFYPVILSYVDEYGVNGVYDVVGKMKDFGVKADFDALAEFILPYCDVVDVEGLLARFDAFNYSLKELISPVLFVLLQKDKAVAAREICNRHNVPIDGEKLIQPLCDCWLRNKRSSNLVVVLQKLCETNSTTIDWAGMFLSKILDGCESEADFKEFLFVIKALKRKKLSVSSENLDHCCQTLKQNLSESELRDDIESELDSLLDITKQEQPYINHPRNMSVDELECQLVELTNKNMETRGVLRLLILKYCSTGNVERIVELRRQFLLNNYAESLGMKSATFHAFVKAGELEGAQEMYKELVGVAPDFRIDNFKLVDFARLLVANGEFEKACNVLKSGGSKKSFSNADSMERNCWSLVGACKTFEQSNTIFNTLVNNGYCRVTNRILGPLMKKLLVEDFERAVEFYRRCGDDYGCTPLQLETMCAAIDRQNETLLNEILASTEKVHGTSATRMAFAAALAEKGQKNLLVKYMSDLKNVRTEEVAKRCKRWVTEDKLSPLKTFSYALSRISAWPQSLDVVNVSIMKVYSRRNDCEGALQFWSEIQNDDLASGSVKSELVKLLKRSKYEVKDALARSTL